MILTHEQVDELLEAAKPLMKWVSDNYHPHCIALVDAGTVELLEGVATNRTEEFIKD
jgi:hypothetical protein